MKKINNKEISHGVKSAENQAKGNLMPRLPITPKPINPEKIEIFDFIFFRDLST